MRIPYAERNRDTLPDNRQACHWELYQGTGRLYLVGPGMDTWWPVTSFRSDVLCHGTPAERDIARRAMALLSIRFHDTTNATPEDIRATLESCGWTACEFTRYPSSKP